ncbi:MAG TPA: hypothetical protein DDY22_02915 [Geobacter sp.]|nr:hypothetical protein [Geobacter sp.]
MSTERKGKLLELGADRLADALLELAGRDEFADDLVERLIATPRDNMGRFRAKLSALQLGRPFVHWRQTAEYARELEYLLEDLRAGVTDPRTGVELVATFYQADSVIFANCDDSNGDVGDLFRHDARDLFVAYASRCADKEWLGDLVIRVIQCDDYGVRDVLIDCAQDYLTEPVMRVMVERLLELAGEESDEYRKRQWFHNIESLARQLKDAPLFEAARLASWGSLSTAACVDIARVYLECGKELTALAWLEKVPAGDSFMSADRDSLLLEIYGRSGNLAEQIKAAWRIFRRGRSATSLAHLLDVIGQDKKGDVLAGEIGAILEATMFSPADADFLVEMERWEAAETYVMNLADQINGDFYGSLLPLAEAMEQDGRPLCASVVYRALLDSILRRGHTKSYPHGVRYLRKLERLAQAVADWRNIALHNVYLQGIKLNHGRKSSFWSRYGGKG